MSLFSELKRRNVFKVGAAYAIVAWLLIQVTATVLPTFGAPHWLLQSLTFIIILGFPLALFFAWAFELTPEGIKPTTAVAADDSITERTGHKLNHTIITLLSLAVIFLVIDNYVLVDKDSGKTAVKSEEKVIEQASEAVVTPAVNNKSVAVLPFLDFSEGHDQTWFADGVAEEILNSLAQLPDLMVTSRTSSFQFRDAKQDPAEIAAKLGVANIVEGSVRRIGDEVRVTAQLIRTSDGFHLWSEVYPSRTEDLFNVQHDIAEKIAAALDIVLDEKKRERMFLSGTHNVEAFEAYQRGWALYEQAHDLSTKATLWDANVYFERAMQLDPGYAQAALAHMDAFAHTVMGGAGMKVDNPPYTPDEALVLLRKDLDFAIANSSTPTMRIIAELNRELFSPTWYRMPALIEQLRSQPDVDSLTLEQGIWLADVLRMMGEYDMLQRMLERSRKEDPLSLIPWLYSIEAAMETGDNAAVNKFIAEGRHILGRLPFFNIVEMGMARSQGKRNEVIQLLNEIIASDSSDNFKDLMLPYAPAILAAISGDYATARHLADEYESGPKLPELSLLNVYYEMGDEDSIRSLASRVDALPGGSARFVTESLFNAGILLFDLKDTPNFAARLAQAGINPDRFRRPFPRLSVLK